jgi:hypothetical protein
VFLVIDEKAPNEVDGVKYMKNYIGVPTINDKVPEEVGVLTTDDKIPEEVGVPIGPLQG